MTNTLFVYGTLCPGKENEKVLAVIGGAFEAAYVKGHHYPNGWIQHFPYPGIELDAEGDEIAGFLFSSPELYRHWGRLDAFEGPNYKRVLTNAVKESGEAVQAFVYVIKDAIAAK